MKYKIIGIAGTNGSGKDTVGLMLAEEFSYMFVSVTDMLREECRNRGLAVERENLRMISAEWRTQYGLGALVDKSWELFGVDVDNFDGLAIASLRNPGEVDRIHEIGGIVVWVDADQKLRFERIQAADRGRGSEDSKTFQQFQQEEEAEMHPPAGSDDTVLNMSAVKERCDVEIYNQGTTEDLRKCVESLFVSR